MSALFTQNWIWSLAVGYPQYRQDGVAKPETGNTLISIPMLATANPIGSIAHICRCTSWP